ncbi:DUF6049 family protein [Planotetraspora sp. A-T 1434]|uniref:DUF6049 family protein n=1 Tax=Planotetraspora sp. A-T 1434 TaxID=2979219 RepID=UPI0021BFBAAF|nr:DUF6049 family protein [Planotetraspora sp. A-T 1434]MCT9934693.1 DUF6049 family protein [Planotetraspora sp. A-T 1434]
MICKAALLTLMTAALLAPPSMAGTAVAAPRRVVAVSTAPADPLLVGQITPEVTSEPATPITISGTVTGRPQTPVQVRIHYAKGQPFRLRSDMASFAADGSLPPSYNTMVQATPLDESGKLPFQFTVTPQELGMSRLGVYPLAIEVLDATTGQRIAIERTFLPYVPKGEPVPKVKLALALPIVDRPHRADDASFMDDDLRTSVASGRLAQLLKLAQGANKNVTWFVDPALLEDVRQMSAGPYTVRSGDSGERKTADAGAGQWLDSLRTALAGKHVVATPYADPDMAALVHNRLDAPAVAALQRGAAVATGLLGREIGTSTAWPAGDTIDRDTIDELATAGVTSVVLSGDALPPASPPATHDPATADPAAAAAATEAATGLDTVSGRITALLADPVLSQILSGEVYAPGSATLARQRFLAETAMLAFEQPNQTGQPSQQLSPDQSARHAARTVVAAPTTRLWNPDPAFLSALLQATSSAPWLRFTSLDSVKPARSPAPRADLVYTERDRQAELGRSYLSTVRKLGQKADAAATITKEHTQLFHDAILRLTSASWRGDTKRAGAYVLQVQAAIDDRLDDVSVIDSPRAVAGANGQVPVSVANNLDKDIVIKIRVTSDNTSRLAIDVPGGAYETDQITVLKARSQLVNVPVTVPGGGGEATIAIQLLTGEDKRYGKPVHVTVRATGYTGIALVIVGAALTIMLAAVVMRMLRRRSRKSFPFSPAQPAAESYPGGEPALDPLPGAHAVPVERGETPPA